MWWGFWGLQPTAPPPPQQILADIFEIRLYFYTEIDSIKSDTRALQPPPQKNKLTFALCFVCVGGGGGGAGVLMRPLVALFHLLIMQFVLLDQ